MDDCERRELAAAYALGALDRADAAAFEAHLRGCATCDADVEAYRDALLVLARGAEPAEPPPALRARILAEVAPAPTRAARPFFERIRWSRPLVAAGFAAAAVAAVLAVVATRGPGGGSAEALLGEPVAAEVALAPSGTGRILVGGDGKVVAQVSLRRPPAGKVYQAWVMPKGDAETAHAAGFVAGDGRRTMVLASRARRGDVVGFTLEPRGGSPKPTSPPVATARV